MSNYSFDSFNDEVSIGKQRAIPSRKSMKMIHEGSVYNGLKCNMEACLGIYHVPISKNLLFEGEDTLVYNAGRSLMKVNIADNRLQCISREESMHVSCINLIQKKEDVIILVGGVYENSSPVLYAFYNKKQTSFIHTNLGFNMIITQACMAQETKKNSIVVTLGGNLISVWLFEKQKLIATGELKLLGCKLAMNHRNQSQLAVCSSHYLRFWEVSIQDKIVKEVPNPHNLNRIERENDFIELSFIPNSSILVAIAYPNTIYLLKDQQIKTTIQHTFIIKSILSTSLEPEISDNPIDVENSVIECLEVTSRGIYIGGENGYVSIYSCENSLLNPIHIFTSRIPNITHVHSLTMSKDEQFLAAVVQPDDVYEMQQMPKHCMLPHSKLEYYLINLNKLESEKATDAIVKLFEHSTHYGGIYGVSVGLSRHFVVSVGEDQFLRVWNLEENKNCFLSTKMPDMPLCVAMHPTGFQVAVGFVDRVKFYYLTNKGLASSVEHLTQETRAVEYSRSGKYLAAGSGKLVLIINAYSQKYLYTINGHMGLVRGITWTGRILTTSCTSGYIFCWNPLKGKDRILYKQNRETEYISCFYDESCDMLACVSNDGAFRVWSNSGNDIVFEALDWECKSLMLVTECKVIVLGLKSGRIRQMLWPIVGGEYLDFAVHMGGIVSLKYIEIDKIIITAGEDGAIGIVKFMEIQMGKEIQAEGKYSTKQKHKKASLAFDTSNFKQFLLVHNSEIEKSNQLKQSLKQRKLQLKAFKKKELEDKETDYSLKLNQLQKSLQLVLNQEQAKSEELTRLLDQQRLENEKFILVLSEKQQNEAVGLELKFNKLRRDEALRYERLKQDREAMKVRCDKELTQILISNDSILKIMEVKYTEKMESVQQAYTKLLAGMRKDAYKYEEVITRSEVEYELEIEKMKEELEQELNLEKIKTKELQTKVSTQDELRKKYDDEKMKEQLETDNLESKGIELQTCVEDLRNRLGKTEEQLKEREEVINRKESTIKELRAFNIHLMNFHFVLNQKIVSLKEEGIPLDEKIKSKEESIKDMYNEILLGFSDQRKVDENLDLLQNKLRSLETISQSMQKDIFNNKKKVTLLQSDLANFIRNSDKKTLVPQLKELCSKYDSDTHEDDIQVQFIHSAADLRHTIEEASINQAQADVAQNHQTLMTKVNTMNKHIIRFNKEKSEEIFRKQHENAFMTKECNLLRNEREHLRKNVSMLISELNQLRQKLGLSSTQPSINISSNMSIMDNSANSNQLSKPTDPYSTAACFKSPSVNSLERRSTSISHTVSSKLSVPKPNQYSKSPVKSYPAIKSSASTGSLTEASKSTGLRKPRPY